MLESLYVKDLAIVDEVRVSFGEGLNIISGETGAGKSVIIGSINLALGGKANKTLIRRGKDFAYTELVFSVDEELEEKLREMDVFPEEGLVTVARRIGIERSMSRINGETVTVAKAKEVSSLLLDLHGQQENHSLLSSKNHMEILDRFCLKESSKRKSELAILVREYRKKLSELSGFQINQVQAERELDFLRFECEEIERAHLLEGEEEALEAKAKKYSYSGKIMEILNEVEVFMQGSKGIEEGISKSVRLVSKLSDLDEAAGGLLDEISNVEALISDFHSSLSDYAEANLFDEADFSMTEKRLDFIRGIYSKHGGSYTSTMKYYEEAMEKMDRLVHLAEYRENREREIEALKAEILRLCNELTKIRKAAAEVFSEEVKKSLIDLNFLQVEFDVDFQKVDEFSSKGNDEIQFLISANPGEPLRNLSEIASGGELSRIMLAMKSVMADTDSIPTLIFDEIDTGISGRTAQMVSEKLSYLSSGRQIIAITHLAQIAAMADHHFLIEKNTVDSHTATQIKELKEEEIVLELARILGGLEITENVLKSAKEMKKLAEELKKSRSGLKNKKRKRLDNRG